MAVNVTVHLKPGAAWWRTAVVRMHEELEMTLPGNTLLALDTDLLLLDPENNPTTLVRLREFRSSADGTVARGHVVRSYDTVEQGVLRHLLFDRTDDAPQPH